MGYSPPGSSVHEVSQARILEWIVISFSRESTCQCRRCRFDPWVRKIHREGNGNPLERQPTPVFLPGESHGQRSLVDYSPWGCKRVRYNLANKQQLFTGWEGTVGGPVWLGEWGWGGGIKAKDLIDWYELTRTGHLRRLTSFTP